MWPVAGYLNSTGGKASYGVRQPSGVVAWGGEQAFLFWIDNGFTTSDVWAAKADLPTPQQQQQQAPTAPGGSATPATAPVFYSYDHTTGAWDLPALPEGFDPLDVGAFLTTPSPAGATGRGQPMFPLAPTAGSVRFSGAFRSSGGAATATASHALPSHALPFCCHAMCLISRATDSRRPADALLPGRLLHR